MSGAENAQAEPGRMEMHPEEKIRAASWWLTWKDLQWPDDDVAEAIERRADAFAESGADCAVIFGAHFRWDYLPLWLNLHDLIGTIADALHRRGVKLFDHHSSVLTHRYATVGEARTMRRCNRHHIPFAPSRDVASTWNFNGEFLDSWRMIDVATGKPVFLPAYTAEEFCINNPGFREAYGKYVRMLLDTTGIDGLMSDDGFFYAGWSACGCPWCRKKFREQYGHELPPVADLAFWGNYASDAFRDWIEMRYASTREFLENVRKAVGPDFPLMSCCSSSADYSMARFALTYQEFCFPCSCIMLEMTGDTPGLDGTWDTHFPEQALHLGIAARHSFPCLGLGYGYTEDTADFIWAFNKFLGSSTWFSTLKGRLGLPDSKMTALKDDPELVGHAYNWEKRHPCLFAGETDTHTALFFSRWTRDFYGMTAEDYTADYSRACLELLNHNVTFDTVTEIPEPGGKYHVLVLCSVQCLSDGEYEALNRFLNAGGCVIASGPAGRRERRGELRQFPWTAQFGILCEMRDPVRPGSFPPGAEARGEIIPCRGVFEGRELKASEWIRVERNKGVLFWTPGRMQCDAQDLDLAGVIRGMESLSFDAGRAEGWRFRCFRGNTGERMIHALASAFDVAQMEELEKQRKNPRGNHLISAIRRRNSDSEIVLKTEGTACDARLYFPLAGYESELPVRNGRVTFSVPPDVYYFIVKFSAAE